jgi:hypothetical protein
MAEIKHYDVVALTEDLPEEHLRRGQVGTVIEIYAPDAFEVEFSDRSTGITYATCVLRADQLMVLHYSPPEPD